eukprot:Pgem_evm1s4681
MEGEGKEEYCDADFNYIVPTFKNEHPNNYKQFCPRSPSVNYLEVDLADVIKPSPLSSAKLKKCTSCGSETNDSKVIENNENNEYFDGSQVVFDLNLESDDDDYVGISVNNPKAVTSKRLFKLKEQELERSSA